MQEITTDLMVDVEDYRNVTDLLVRRAAIAPVHAAFDVALPRTSGEQNSELRWRQVSTREYLSEVRTLAKSFIASGIEPGDTIAIMAPTRYEWAVVDLAVWFAGGVVVPIYDTSSLAQVTAIVADARVRLAIGGSSHHCELLNEAFTTTATGELGVWSMDDSAKEGGVCLKTLAARAHHTTDADLEARRLAADLDSPATIVYTSGTTGEPKGAVLTHRNFLGQVTNIAAAYREVVHEGGNTIIFLPLAHVLARGLQLICLASGMRIAHLADPTLVVPSLATLRPTFLVVVPRVLQKIEAAAAKKADAKKLGKLWRAARETAVEWGIFLEKHDADGSRAPKSLRARHAFFDALFFRRLRTVMGNNLDYILSGGARLDRELSLFFRGIGAPVIEGYGLTETTAPLTGNLPGRIRSGTVGPPLPGSSVRISEHGEILAKGIGVFSGYRNDAHNADAFIDGYFRTGDLGMIDDAGNIVLQGRLKDVIVTSGGKTIVPTAWEGNVEKDDLVAHAVMIGEGRSYLSALILLDPEQANAWALLEGVDVGLSVDSDKNAELHEIVNERLTARIQSVVDDANSLVARSEQVRRFVIVSADATDPTLVTPTLKIKRRALLDRGSLVVQNLYANVAPTRKDDA